MVWVPFGAVQAVMEAANSLAERPPRMRRWIELMVSCRLAISALEHLEKSIPFGYHLRTSRLAFSTEPFSYEA